MNIKEFDISCWIAEKFNKISSSDKIAFLFAVFVGFCAHGAALVGFFINEDDNIGGWVGFCDSGRFFADIIYGCIEYLPFQFLQTFLFILLVSCSGVLVANLFSTRSTFSKALIAALVVAYPAFSVGVTYTFVILVYAMAVSFSICSVYFVNREGWGNFFIAVLLLALSLGTYQAYLSVAAILCASLLLLYAINNNIFQDNHAVYLFKKACRYALFGIASGVVYLIAVKLSTIYHNAPLGGNQGADKMGSVDVSLAALKKIYGAYVSFSNNVFFSMPAFFYDILIVVAVLAVVVVVLKAISKGRVDHIIGSLLLEAFLLAVVLVAGFAVTFVAPYSEINILQTYGIMILLCLAIALITNFSTWFKNIAFVLSILIIVMFINRNNAQYYKATLATKSSLDTVSRIFARVEKKDGFNADSKIALVGTLPNTVLKSNQKAPFDERNSGYSGNFVGLSRPNQSNKFSKLMAFLGYDVKHAENSEELLRAYKKAVNMPTYPAKGSIQVDGNLIVIKLNEPRLILRPESLGDQRYHFEYTPLTDSKNLEFTWLAVSVTQKTGKRIITDGPQLNVKFDVPGETCYVVASYRDRGSNKVMESVPYWFIVK